MHQNQSPLLYISILSGNFQRNTQHTTVGLVPIELVLQTIVLDPVVLE